MVNKKMNYANENFNTVISLLSEKVPQHDYRLENIYLDYGAGMRWETIVCYRNGSENDSYQMLYPREWEEIKNATDKDDLIKIAEKIIKDQKDLLFRIETVHPK